MNVFDCILTLGKKPQFASMVTRTEPTLVKPSSNPFKGLIKVSYRSVIFNFIYENSVRKQLEREGKNIEEYISGGRRNGLEYIGESKCLMFHPEKGTKYAWVKQEKELETKFFLDGKEVEKDKLVGYLYEQPTAKTQDCIDKKIFSFNVKLENILEITANGITYR